MKKITLSGFKKAKDIKQYYAKKYYSNRCYVCHKKYGKYFAFHHLWYEEDDAIYSNFKGNSDKYHIALERFIISNPKRFLLLCKAHHHLVEWGASLKDKNKWLRFCKARSMTKT